MYVGSGEGGGGSLVSTLSFNDGRRKSSVTRLFYTCTRLVGG